jgi:hypothetical protein
MLFDDVFFFFTDCGSLGNFMCARYDRPLGALCNSICEIV